MEAQNMEVSVLVEKITGLHGAISKLPSLSPSPEVDELFTDLVMACVPASPVDVTQLDPETQKMRRSSFASAPTPRESSRRTTPTCSPVSTTRSTTSAVSRTSATTLT
jgi:hypothetical protein